MSIRRRVAKLEQKEADRRPTGPDKWSVEAMIGRMSPRDIRELLDELARRAAEVKRIEERNKAQARKLGYIR